MDTFERALTAKRVMTTWSWSIRGLAKGRLVDIQRGGLTGKLGELALMLRQRPFQTPSAVSLLPSLSFLISAITTSRFAQSEKSMFIPLLPQEGELENLFSIRRASASSN